MDSSENYCALKRMPILYERTRCLSDGINAIDIFQAHGCWIHAAINTITSLKKNGTIYLFGLESETGKIISSESNPSDPIL